MRVVALPVKNLVDAKQRLVSALSPAQRQTLAAAMLEDVLAALAATRVDQVWMVTRDPDAEALASRYGAIVVREDSNRGHTAAVATAQARATAHGAAVFATIPGDVPYVTAAEIDALLDAAHTSPAAVFTPSRSGLGTNGVALAPADAMPLRFGEPSFEAHLEAARERGLVPRVLPLSGLALDVDGPEDLLALRDTRGATRTARLVASWAGARPTADARAAG